MLAHRIIPKNLFFDVGMMLFYLAVAGVWWVIIC